MTLGLSGHLRQEESIAWRLDVNSLDDASNLRQTLWKKQDTRVKFGRF